MSASSQNQQSSTLKSDPADMSATELLDAFAAGALSPVEALDAALKRIETYNPALNAFCVIDYEGARAQARVSEERWRRKAPAGLVDGVPTTIKDMFLMRGWPTLRGSLTIDPSGPWDEDSPLVARLREHGAVFLGKTTQPEFGWKAVTDSPIHGITRNPWDSRMTSGGSSGGAAVAAATGMGALHAGGDGGGSIRIPASFCGIYGLKPSFGRVPNYPSKMPGSITHAGPMTRTVADAALMLTVMAGPDHRDWRALPSLHHDYRNDLAGGLAGLSIGYSPSLGFDCVDPDVTDLVASAARVMEDLGATVEEVDIDLTAVRQAFEVYYFARFVRLYRLLGEAERSKLDPGILEMVEAGHSYGVAELLDADALREELGGRMKAFHTKYDLLLTPQMPIAAFEAGRDVPSGGKFRSWLDWSPFTYPFNFTQQPAATIPCGRNPAGLPVGLQLVGDRYREDLVLRASHAFEQARPFAMPV